jgi:acetylornithine deacetylase/succinyl-diaminopimelate desuccinylase-like protein
MPLKRENGRLYGPGVFDMKAGIGLATLATRAVIERHGEHDLAIVMLWTTDEEVGSGTSRALIEAEASKSEAVLVFEPSLPGGALKTSRKGVGQFEMIARGVSAHAGLDPGKGVSAVRELARQIIAIDDLQDPANGVTVTVGVIQGGSRANVVPAEARATIDARANTRADADRLQRTIARRSSAPTRWCNCSSSRKWWPRTSASRCGKAAPAAAPTAISPPPLACRPSTASAPSATARTRCTSTSRSMRWCPAPPS